MRCASRTMELSAKFFNLDIAVPSWYTGRLWLMRLGYYKLNCPKEYANDWVWIIDHSVQIGKEKCFVILGIRLKDLPDRPLTFTDVEPIELAPVKQSNGDIVYQQLESATGKTGVPREIISDGAGDIQAGINLFCQVHPQTCAVYDIKHKNAIILKRHFEQDKSWAQFLGLCSATKLKVQQTELSFLSSPNQRSKSRYMNIDTLVSWGKKVLRFIECEAKDLPKEVQEDRLKQYFSWIKAFHKDIDVWHDKFSVCRTAENCIRKHGFSQDMMMYLESDLKQLNLCEQSYCIQEEVLSFVGTQCNKARTNEKLLGSTEVIESLFGRQKYLEKEQSRSGFTGLILSISAFVSTTTKEVIARAMESVPTKTIRDWVKEKLGDTVQSNRKRFLCGPKSLGENGAKIESKT